MSWLLDLYETYKANSGRVGVKEKRFIDREQQKFIEYTLLPISHTTQTAHIEVRVTENGDFHSAEVIDKNDANTLIPCTEDSASRAGSKVAPYPLHDKLSYVAGDFTAYGGVIKKEEPFRAYIEQLADWANSPYAHENVKSIYTYLKKGRLIEDLVADRKLAVDEQGHLIGKWDKKYASLYEEKPAIFSSLAGEQSDAFIRFTVHSTRQAMKKTWDDPEMYESFVQYYNHKLGDKKLCYVTGEIMPGTSKHANKIRNPADKAKLISANDKTGFTFRGRYSDSEEVASISYEVSQKAHNALKWLIHRQGKVIDQRVFLVWSNGDDSDIVPPEDDTYTFLPGVATTLAQGKSFTNDLLAGELWKALGGYKNKYADSKAKVSLLVLDSATTGRMAVLYYRHMAQQDYFKRLVDWHSTCVWLHRYQKNQQGEYVIFYGAPATRDIAFAAYGSKAGDKVVKGLMERMLPTIIDGRHIPIDIVRSAFQRASNPVSMEKWEWEKTLSITCALINYGLIQKKEGYEVALDKENQDRDYLFGRLLAVADVLERRALGNEENRASNAIRYMNSFAQHPARTWTTIQASLQPYQARLGAKGNYLSGLIDEIASKLKFEDFNNKPLSGKYLLGFYSQRHDLYQKKEKTGVASVDTVEQSNDEEME